jgi:hypothetical protein
MTPPDRPDRPRRSAGPRPNRPGPIRPREAPRPERQSSSPSSTGGSDIHLRPATFVDLSADQERHAIKALAELLVPLLTDPHRILAEPGSDPSTEPIVQTGPALFCSAAEQGPPLLPE